MSLYRIGDRVRFWDVWRGKRFLRLGTVNGVSPREVSVVLGNGELRAVRLKDVVRYGLVELEAVRADLFAGTPAATATTYRS